MAKKRAKGAPAGSPAHPAVRVRMYRQGLGDCFLLTFNLGADEKHMLIDCGTLGTAATEVSIAQVVQDIAQTTKRGAKSELEILVVTHAHKDHVSGYGSQDDAFGKFNIANVWMGWTEDPSDALAKSLGNSAARLHAALSSALAAPGVSQELHEKLAGVAEFEGLAGMLGMGDTIAQAIDNVRGINGARTVYHSPGGAVVELASIPGFRFYVLGPPRDAGKLGITGDDGSDELYGLASALRAGADTAGATGACTARDDSAPFDRRYCYPLSAAAEMWPEYVKVSESYRRVDGQWMDAAAELAAKLDRYRNNTSLALAIERIADGKVLLFPADAQEGNWLSWHDPQMKWKVKDASGAEKTVNAADLLQRTVFYKVGHHGSHNATARGKGLELMRKGKDLTAFIPVDRQVALSKTPKNSWQMPTFALYRELLEACKGRVVRADLGWADDAKAAARPDVEKDLQKLATGAEWEHWRSVQKQTGNVTIGKLAVDYVLK